MAITGTGTQADPWIVHSYNELSQLRTLAAPENLGYAELGNDIDCNDYGASFAWNTIELRTSNDKGIDLDLSGHTIKNIIVALNNSIFQLFTYSTTYYSRVHNGKILNIYTYPNSQAFLMFGNFNNTYIPEAYDLSISYSMSVGAFSIFYRVKPSRIAAYIEGIATTSNGIFMMNGDNVINISECDIKVNCAIASNTRIIAQSSAVSFPLKDSRISGKLVGYGDNKYLNAYYVMDTTVSNCVIDVDTSEMEWITSQSQYRHPVRTGSTGAINVSDRPSNDNDAGNFASGLIQCTTEEIRNGDALRSKGFVVVNVSA